MQDSVKVDKIDNLYFYKKTALAIVIVMDFPLEIF